MLTRCSTSDPERERWDHRESALPGVDSRNNKGSVLPEPATSHVAASRFPSDALTDGKRPYGEDPERVCDCAYYE